jgi:hypothetical protein
MGKGEQSKIEQICDTTKAVCKILEPLSQRQRERVLKYFFDLVNDPEEDFTVAEVEIMKKVDALLNKFAGR